MCFSATASFSASVILGAAGVAGLRIAKHPKQKMFAAIPLIFAIQQFTEGCVWIASTHPHYAFLHTYAIYVFLVFAQVVWPVWVPLSIHMFEKGWRPHWFLNVTLGIGVCVSLYMIYGLVFYPVTGQIEGHHIRYVMGYPDIMVWPTVMLYGMATVLPPFVSDIKGMRLLGIALVVSYIVSAILFEYYITSVWCYFAAALSVIILLILWELRKHHDL